MRHRDAAALLAGLADRFEAIDPVGAGGMATVYRATRIADGATVAIKVLDPRLQRILGAERFDREIAILSRLDHPAILPMLDYGNASGFRYYVMPFVSGPTLRDRIRLLKSLPMDEAIAVTATILDALEYAHRKNVIHRDIKPENVLLQDGRPLVADFGIARAIVLSAGDQISSTGIVIGTPTYMSPEQAAGEPELDGRSDVYAAGCLLYEMLAGEPPFTGPTAQAVHARHRHDVPPSIRVVRAEVSVALENLVMKALAKQPADRFQSAAAFRTALDRGSAGPADRSLPASLWWRFGRADGRSKSKRPAPGEP